MVKLEVYDQNKNKVKEVEAPEEVFAYPVKEHLLYEAVINYRANQRRGTASTKTRGEVRGGGRKPWRQKGTGRARVGSIRSPLWRKGGIVFGPKPRDYSYQMPKKARRNALKSALAMKLAAKQLFLLESINFDQPKTKLGVEFLKKFELESALIVDLPENKNMFLSLRNIPGITPKGPDQVTVYDVLNHECLVLSQRAYESLMERLK
ncbi:50S ribosomal protein L4 [Candidatus Aminicenantes bacterium AC-334-K16]|jgi:large subunit ribosomal protein L4|nr:50S ribosomal protein L4 [Candidatus Aminicenantes bacterium AC-334-K16]